MTSPDERRYRRMLRAYPRAYREHRGAEILTTLLEMAEDGRRPGVHLVLSGLGQRFKLPARRPLAWVAAVLAAVVLGGFGAAAGTWTGWRTGATVPADRELRALNVALTGLAADAVFHDTSAQRGPSVPILTDGTADWSAARVRDTLTGAGWQITSLQESEGLTMPPREDLNTGVPTTFGTWTATRDGLKMRGDGRVVTGSPFTGLASYRITVWPAEPAALRPLTVAGFVGGLLAGWLLVASLARRRLATALATAGLAAATPVAVQLLRGARDVMAYPHGSPYPGNVDVSPGGALTLIGTAAGLLIVVAAVIAARRRPADRARPA